MVRALFFLVVATAGELHFEMNLALLIPLAIFSSWVFRISSYLRTLRQDINYWDRFRDRSPGSILARDGYR